MFKNCVFKVSVSTKKWFAKALSRALKTMAQSAIAAIGTTALFTDVDWRIVLSTAVLAGVLSILTSISGIPEVQSSEQK